jgi:hypothetical protein
MKNAVVVQSKIHGWNAEGSIGRLAAGIPAKIANKAAR